MREVPITPWHVEQTPGGFKVLDANGQALVSAKPCLKADILARKAKDQPWKARPT